MDIDPLRRPKQVKQPQQPSLFDDPPQEQPTRTRPVAQDAQSTTEPSPTPATPTGPQGESSTWSDSLAYLFSWGH